MYSVSTVKNKNSWNSRLYFFSAAFRLCSAPRRTRKSLSDKEKTSGMLTFTFNTTLLHHFVFVCTNYIWQTYFTFCTWNFTLYHLRFETFYEELANASPVFKPYWAKWPLKKNREKNDVKSIWTGWMDGWMEISVFKMVCINMIIFIHKPLDFTWLRL